jgi:hypothetical protein
MGHVVVCQVFMWAQGRDNLIVDQDGIKACPKNF